jgi:hypothetical protein
MKTNASVDAGKNPRHLRVRGRADDLKGAGVAPAGHDNGAGDQPIASKATQPPGVAGKLAGSIDAA